MSQRRKNELVLITLILYRSRSSDTFYVGAPTKISVKYRAFKTLEKNLMSLVNP
jgi:hypothetical protein